MTDKIPPINLRQVNVAMFISEGDVRIPLPPQHPRLNWKFLEKKQIVDRVFAEYFTSPFKKQREDLIQDTMKIRAAHFKKHIRPSLRKKDIQILKKVSNRIRVHRDRVLFHHRRKSL